MQRLFCIALFIVLTGSLIAQTENTGHRHATKAVFEGRPAIIRLAPHLSTMIRLPEPVNSVVVGDSNHFEAEYSPDEPLLVFVRPIGPGIAQSNLAISTVLGRQFVLLLTSPGTEVDDGESGVDVIVTCRAAGVRFIAETFSDVLISETVQLRSAAHPPAEPPENGFALEDGNGLALDEILSRQRQQTMGTLVGDRIRVGMGPVTEDGSRLIVAFSVVSATSEAIELVPPQVQLAGQTQSGLFRRTRWATVQQLPVQAYQFSQRRIDPGGRIDGVVVFERPAIKQSTEGLLLQIADSAAVDQPTLAPISFRQTQPLEKDHE